MNRIIKKTLLAIALSTTLPLVAQEVININDAIRIGLENNYDLKIVRNEQQISDNNNTIGNAGYLPTLGVSSGYNIRNNSSDNIPAVGGESTDVNTTGTQSLDASVNLNWTIFDGFKVKTNHKRLKELQSMGELNTRLSIENFIADISAEYYNLVQQTQYLKNLKQAVDLSRERLRIVEARYQIGSFSRLDLQQAKVDFNTDSSQLIQQYEVLHRSRIKLNELMGSHDIETLVSASDSTINVNRLLQKDILFDDMMQNNTTLLISEKNKTLSELELKSLQSQNYPYLRLNGSYGFTHYNYSNSNLDQQRNWGPSAGVTLGFNIFDGFNRKREQKNARIKINNQELIVDRQK
ncbi:MAG: TolC family protein, partial [Proteiniphilum sp.]|nr:TolC family protein [Proteiniphilum sp.]